MIKNNDGTDPVAPPVIDDTPVDAVASVEEATLPEVEEALEIEEPVVEEEPEAVIKETLSRKPQHVTQDYPISQPGESTQPAITFPANFDKETRDVLERMPNVNLLDSPQTRKWAEDVADGLELTTHNEAFVSTLETDGADFKQKLEDNGISLMAGSPKFKSIQNETLKGERAVIRFISHLGLGTLFQTPLWHSGIWVTFKPPTESELIELNRILVADKIQFGRYTYGLVYSNLLSYTTDRLVDFALAHVYDLTAKSDKITTDNLKEHLSCLDIPSLLWGFVCTMYPKGFKYRRACITDPEKCNYVLEELLNLFKLQWTNNAALTEWQKTFMAGRQSKSKDADTILRYQGELKAAKHKRLVINEGLANEIAITLKTPTVTQYIEAGYRWISDITDTVSRTLGLNATDDERSALITRYGQASAMRQYIHWVESIEYDTNSINDTETIEGTLDVLSADDEVRTQFIKGVIDYINENTISIIGIPVYDCPKCKHSQEVDHQLPHHTNIIPIDVIQLFFALLGSRMGSLINR